MEWNRHWEGEGGSPETLDGRDAGYVGGEEGDGSGERGDEHGHARVPQSRRHPPLQMGVERRLSRRLLRCRCCCSMGVFGSPV